MLGLMGNFISEMVGEFGIECQDAVDVPHVGVADTLPPLVVGVLGYTQVIGKRM